MLSGGNLTLTGSIRRRFASQTLRSEILMSPKILMSPASAAEGPDPSAADRRQRPDQCYKLITGSARMSGCSTTQSLPSVTWRNCNTDGQHIQQRGGE